MTFPRTLARAGLFSLLVMGCRESFSPDRVVAGAVTIDPPSEYLRWWLDTERCSGITGAFGRIQWYVVPDAPYFTYRGERYDGYWWETHDIVLAGEYLSDSGTVRHEMLHDLLNSGEHPVQYFLDRCGDVVR